ncbi:MAG: hypothetical protein ACJ8EY_04680 [Sphingomicrobium sp.]
MVKRHVREGERHLASQRQVVIDLREHGHGTGLAEQLLVNLEELQKMHREHLARLQ